MCVWGGEGGGDKIKTATCQVPVVWIDSRVEQYEEHEEPRVRSPNEEHDQTTADLVHKAAANHPEVAKPANDGSTENHHHLHRPKAKKKQRAGLISGLF